MDKISKRSFLKGAPLLGITAGGPILASAATHSEKPLSKQETLLDPHYHSESGWQFGSQAIHHGEQEGYQVTPISQDKCAPGYQRPGNLKNPTVSALLRKVTELEGTQAAVGGPCGMGIIAQTYMALLRPGDRVVAHRCNYDWVMTLLREYLPSWGIEVQLLDFNQPEQLEESLQKRSAKLVHWEPYVNPSMEVLDTQRLVQIAKSFGALSLVDNTWLTPYLLQPAALGADLVMHSVTKYMGGHGNAMGGVVSGRKDLISTIERSQNWLGGLLRPMDAFMVTQGVKTLPLRMTQHSKTAQVVAEYLADHPAVKRVRYGGLSSWNALGQQASPRGFGGMLGIEWKHDRVHQSLGNHVRLILNATSLGDPCSRIMARQQETDRGIPARYTRVSIGLEEADDLMTDFEQAIEKC